jgi:2'-5' RNA ligase
MRVFVAIEIAEELRRQFALAQEKLKCAPGVKWVAPENFHLTLRFLGWTEPGIVSRLANEMGAVAAATPAFEMSFAGGGAFPSISSPRVVWIGVKEGMDQLFGLAQKAEAIAQKLGFEAETRPFQGHLTLGRARRGISLKELSPEIEAMANEDFGRQTVEHITIMESILSRSGPTYKPLHKLVLGKNSITI